MNRTRRRLAKRRRALRGVTVAVSPADRKSHMRTAKNIFGAGYVPAGSGCLKCLLVGNVVPHEPHP